MKSEDSVCLIGVTLLCAVALLPSTHAGEGTFSYYNQSFWGGSCGSGNRQSPIFISTVDAIGSTALGMLDLVGWNVPVSGSFENTGSTVKFTPTTMDATLRNHLGVYTVKQFHFHWGENDTVGSEHMVDSTPFAAELHFVTSKNTGSGMSGDSFSVVAVMFEADDTATDTGIWAKLAPPTQDDTSINVTDIVYSDLLPAGNLDYYHYEGSLTTPPCSEYVQWFVLKTPNKIPSSYLQRLRKIENDFNSTLVRDYREVQPVNARTVFQFTNGSARSSTCGVVSFIAAVVLCLLFAQFNN